MTFPFMADPVPPGHGEAVRQPDDDRTYVVLVTPGDGVSSVESSWGNLTEALKERDRVRAELRESGYHHYHAGVQDEDDPERGYLEWDDE